MCLKVYLCNVSYVLRGYNDLDASAHWVLKDWIQGNKSAQWKSETKIWLSYVVNMSIIASRNNKTVKIKLCKAIYQKCRKFMKYLEMHKPIYI